MIRRTAIVAACLLAGGAVIAGLYWAFLNTPESNVLMLVASAILVLLMAAVSAVVINAAVLVSVGGNLISSLRSGARRIGWALLVAIPVALLVWVILRADSWVIAHAGNINAWFIAKFGWADVTPLFRTEDYLSTWLRWVLLPVTAVAALASVLQRGSLAPRQWLRGAWHWRTLLIATLAYVVLVALPWRAAYWHPQGLPTSWVQPALAGFRLALVAIAMAIGASVMFFAAARRASQDTNHAAQ
jgi:hypothetical protein